MSGQRTPPACASTDLQAAATEQTHTPGADVELIARLLPFFEREAVRDFFRLLGHHLATTRPAQRREQRLGLLRTLFELGEFPSVATYTAALAEEAAAGREWPTVDQLGALFGSYQHAVGAALRYARNPGQAPPSRKQWRKTRQVKYTVIECEQAVERCRTSLGLSDWPSPTAFFAWTALGREIAGRWGHARHPRLPAPRSFHRCYDKYEDAIDAIQRRHRLAATAAERSSEASASKRPKPRRRRHSQLEPPRK